MKGITITLLNKLQTGTDWANNPIYEDVPEEITDVLVGEPTTDDVQQALELYGKHIQYTLAIPKGDTHDWVDTKVILPEPFAGEYKTIGYPTAGIESNIPLRWNKKVKVERYAESEV